MPNSWQGDYNFTSHQNGPHKNCNKDDWAIWNTDLHPVPYYRPHTYIDENNIHWRHHLSSPDTSLSLNTQCTSAGPSHGYFNPSQQVSITRKRKYTGSLTEEEQMHPLNLQAEISAKKIVIFWNFNNKRKDIFYTITAICTSAACNFSTAVGQRWTFDQKFAQTRKVLTTTPGNVYRIIVQCREIASKNVITWEEKEFKACMDMEEHEQLYRKAVDLSAFIIDSLRCKPKFYWDYIHLDNNDWMEKYIKDNNGQPANQINGRIHGLFFSGRLTADGQLPNTSPFGDVRMLMLAGRLLNPEHHNFYFADFYCNYHTHYVTIVVCVKDSDTDRFCSTHCLKMDIFNNPFLEIRREFDYAQYAPRTMYYINKKVWVEIYYTENIHLNWGRFSPIVATGAGTSKLGGLPNNKACLECNLYPTRPVNDISYDVHILPELQNPRIDDDLLNALDLTVQENQIHSSTFILICEQDQAGLEAIWCDLAEVVCSLIDGACETVEPDKEPLIETIIDDIIVQSNKEIRKLLKNTDEEICSNPVYQAVPKIQEIWELVKEHSKLFESKILDLASLLPDNANSISLSVDLKPLSTQSDDFKRQIKKRRLNDEQIDAINL